MAALIEDYEITDDIRGAARVCTARLDSGARFGTPANGVEP